MICLDIDYFVFFILYNIVNLAFVFLSSNVCPFRFSNLSLTDDLLWYLFVTNRTVLHHFYFIRVLLQIWVPDWASLLHRWSYKGDVSLFFDFTVGYIQISFQESNSFICFLTDVCYMAFPLEVWCNCYAKIFCWWYMFESVVMKVIILLYRRFLLYNGKHLTFIRIELHHPLYFPYCHLRTLQRVPLLILYHLACHWYRRGKDWSQYRSLWYCSMLGIAVYYIRDILILYNYSGYNRFGIERRWHWKDNYHLPWLP